MAKGRKGKDDKKAKEAKEAKLELDIINRIVLFYTNKETTHEQRLQVRDALKEIIPNLLDEPKLDDTGGA